MIRSIFAIDADGGIGKDGTLPWPKDSEDLSWFKANTLGDIVVMGKNTWLDPMMPKPLPNRLNVVVANRGLHACDAAHLVISGSDLDQTLIDLSEKNSNKNLWIIGGAQLLRSTAHLVQQSYVTRFSDIYDCDVKLDINLYLTGFKMVRGTPGNRKVFEVYEKLS
jgi:dihydrofolate reductase